MNVVSTYSITMTCRLCHKQVGVTFGVTPLVEMGSGKNLSVYYSPDASAVAGVSEGSGDSFECLHCHAARWYEQYGREMRKQP